MLDTYMSFHKILPQPHWVTLKSRCIDIELYLKAFVYNCIDNIWTFLYEVLCCATHSNKCLWDRQAQVQASYAVRQQLLFKKVFYLQLLNYQVLYKNMISKSENAFCTFESYFYHICFSRVRCRSFLSIRQAFIYSIRQSVLPSTIVSALVPKSISLKLWYLTII